MIATGTTSHLPPGASRVLWTLGHLLMLAGVYLVVALGGMYATVSYQLQAARGESDLVPIAASVIGAPPGMPSVALRPRLQATAVPQQATALPFVVPRLADAAQVTSALPPRAAAAHRSTVTRVLIPRIGVDSKVVEVGWDVVEEDGQQYAVWQVAEYAVGQHRGSANPGEGDNIVLAAHVGGYGKVFRDLYYVQPGDAITLVSNGQQYLYTVQERLVVDEEGVPEAQRQANAALLAPMGEEMVTLMTCWPLTGNDRFTQRVVVRALPYGAEATPLPQQGPSPWTMR